MHFPRYWAKGVVNGTDRDGKARTFSCWGWSDKSAVEAEQMGCERAGRALERMLRGEAPLPYPYGQNPLREEVLQKIKGVDGEIEAVITRNSYGCRVLNATTLMFIDIDFTEKDPREAMGAKLGRLFGKKMPAEDPRETRLLAEIEKRMGDEPEIGARIYRTKAGMRLFFTHRPFQPTAEEAMRWMEALGADPLYIRLCKSQQCFRARLSPKPWRCGMHVFPAVYPWADDKIRSRFTQWENKYLKTAESYATCRFIKHIGEKQAHESLSHLISLHDRETRATSDLKLA